MKHKLLLLLMMMMRFPLKKHKKLINSCLYSRERDNYNFKTKSNFGNTDY